MLRLVQGDVGAGRTVVAALAAIESGIQALLATAELLAAALPEVRVGLVHGRLKPKEKEAAMAAFAARA